MLSLQNTNALHFMEQLEPESVHLIVTDPPYIISKDSGMDKQYNLVQEVGDGYTKTEADWLIYKEKDFKKKIALSFITGGAFGNILDRINDGKVTDFLHLKVMDFSLFVFNLADLFITICAILIIYFEIIYRIKDD